MLGQLGVFGNLFYSGNSLNLEMFLNIFAQMILPGKLFLRKKNFDVVQLLCKSGFGANSESSLHWGFNKVSFLILVAETIPAIVSWIKWRAHGNSINLFVH